MGLYNATDPMKSKQEFEIDDIVVIQDCHWYQRKYANMIGTVKKISGTCVTRGNIGVRIDGEINQNSSYGLFWFNPEDLKLKNNIVKEDNEMALNGDYKVAVVKFERGYNLTKEYSFALYPSEQDSVTIGGHVLVDNGSYDICKVVNIIDKKDAACQPTKEVICSVDFSNFNARKQARSDKKELIKKMNDIAKKSQELALFKMIAKNDTEMAELLHEYSLIEDV